MRLPSILRRLALSVAAGSLALTGLALPAQADPPGFDVPLVGIMSPETVTVINGQAKTVKIELINVGGPAEDVVLEFGDKTVPAGLGFTPPAGCTGTTCEIGDLKPGERRIVRFGVKPSNAAPAHVLRVATVVGELTSFEVDVAVVRTAKGGADLEMGEIKNLKLGRGESAEVPFVVSNTGNRAVKAVALVVLPMQTGVEALLDYRNCENEPEFDGFVCVFNEPLAAGGTFTLPAETPLAVRVRPDAPGPFDYPVMMAVVGLTEKYAFDFAARTAGAKGEVLELEAAATASADEPETAPDLNEDDNLTEFTVAVPKSSADSAAVGGAFRGAIGETKTAEVGIRNLGPTGTVPPSMTAMPYVHVRVPTGVELTEIDFRCFDGKSPYDPINVAASAPPTGRDFVCLTFDSLTRGGKDIFAFTGKILDKEHRAGKVTVHGGVQDNKHGNDTAAFTVEVTGGAGGGLPITGAPAGLVAGAGALLLAGGVLAYVMARRRRIVTVVD